MFDSRLWSLLLAVSLVGMLPAADLESPPIRYSKTPADNPVARLQQRIDAGKARLTREPASGYLRALLKELKIPISSQVLVFSKTSFQRHRIGPPTPRALYFNDDVYIGYCHQGDVIEVSAADPKLGAVFYTCTQKPAGRPRFQRQEDTCLICHGSSQNQGFPGHLVRSLYVDEEGFPILSSGSYRTDHTSPLAQRWGGWYVTGTSGKQLHMGNLLIRDKSRQPEETNNTAGTNVTDLSGLVDTSHYLTPHSDIVALMVLEHQVEMHNRLARAGLLTRIALHEGAELNKALGRPVDYRSESTMRRIQNAGEPVVQYLLFSGETALTGPIQGTSEFTKEFSQRGPRDKQGRSLRDFDLKQRLFKYPCSYLIYSTAFQSLPGPVKDYIVRRLDEVLSGKDTSKEFVHLSLADRRAIREILRETGALGTRK
jgi:hypothetical protein